MISRFILATACGISALSAQPIDVTDGLVYPVNPPRAAAASPETITKLKVPRGSIVHPDFVHIDVDPITGHAAFLLSSESVLCQGFGKCASRECLK